MRYSFAARETAETIRRAATTDAESFPCADMLPAKARRINGIARRLWMRMILRKGEAEY